MKLLFSLFLVALCCHTAMAQKSTKNKLLGVVSKEEVQRAPFDQWFTSNYENYQPEAEVVTSLEKTKWKHKTIELFYGTWCGDSRREVPKMLKLLDEIGFPESQLKIIAVNNSRKQYKQSPTHEEEGKNIIRVPTLIVYHKGKEMNRFVEYPRETLAADFLKIIKEADYTPQYTENVVEGSNE